MRSWLSWWTKRRERLVAQRVDRGAQRLDQKDRFWFLKIDSPTLNLQFAETCVLGQVFVNYRTGLQVLGIERSQAVRFGFHIAVFSLNFDRLDQAWKREIACRLAKWEKDAAWNRAEAVARRATSSDVSQ